MKNGKLLLILAVTAMIFIFISSCRETPANPDGYINISGSVVNVDGTLINGAKVDAVDATDKIIATDITSENSVFSLSNIPANVDNIYLVVTKVGYKTLKVSLKSLLENVLDNKIILVLEKDGQNQDCCGNIHFTITDEASRTPINDVEVKLSKEGSVIAKYMTTKEGKVDFEKLCPGNYWVRVYREGYAVIEKQITVANCDPINVNLLLVKSNDEPCCGVVNMMVFDKASKAGIAEAKVILNYGDKAIETKYSDARGVVGFTGLCMGKYWVKIVRTGYKDIIEYFNIINCDPLNITFAMEKAGDDPCCGKIYFKLYDKSNEKRLGGKEVTLYKGNVPVAKQVTNENGEGSFTELCVGSYVIKVAAEGYKTLVYEVKVTNCEPITLTLALEPSGDKPCCGKIIVTTYDKETQKPIAGVEVKLTFEGKVLTQKTDENGVAAFDGLCMGKYGLRIAREGYKVVEQYVKVENCDPINITAIMEKSGDNPCCGKIHFTIMDKATGKPISGAEVKLTSADGKVVLTQKTNESGLAGFGELCMGKYYIRIAREGYKVIEQYIVIENCDLIQKSIGLEAASDNPCCKGILYTTVIDQATQKPIIGAYVKLFQNGKVIKSAKTGENGVAVIDGICEGDYSVSITADGFIGIEYKYTQPCDQTIKEHKTLVKNDDKPCCGKLYFSITDKATGKPVVSAEVKITSADGKVVLTQKTNENGAAGFGELCMGKYFIRIAREGYKVVEQYVYIENCEPIQKAIALESASDNPCCKGVLKVTILDKATQKPIPVAYLKLTQGGKVLKTAKVNDAGIASMDGICEGDYVVYLYADGYNVVEYKYTHACNKVIEETKYLEKKEAQCTGKLKLQYVDPTTNEYYVSNAEVKLMLNGKQIAATTTNSEGWAVFEGLCTGKYIVNAAHEGYAIKEADYSVTTGQTTTDKLEMVPVK